MVRVAADKERLRTARLSLLVALLAGGIAFAVWLIMRDVPIEEAPQRSLTHAVVEWVCELDSQHRFFLEGRFEPLPCQSPNCPGMCHIRLDYVCLEHGQVFEVFADFERAPPGSGASEQVARYRYRMSDPWIEAANGQVRCPIPGCTSLTRRPHTVWSDISRRRPSTPRPGR